MNSGSLPGREPRRTKHLPLIKCCLCSPRTPRPWVSGGKVRHGGGLTTFRRQIETWRLSRPSRSNRPSKLGHRSPAVYDSHANPGAFQPSNMPCLIINSIYLLISCRLEGLVDSSLDSTSCRWGVITSCIVVRRPYSAAVIKADDVPRTVFASTYAFGMRWSRLADGSAVSNGVKVAVVVAHAVRSSSVVNATPATPTGRLMESTRSPFQCIGPLAMLAYLHLSGLLPPPTQAL